MKKTGLFTLILFFSLVNFAYAGDKVNLAIATEGKTITAQVSGVAARSSNFLIFDSEFNLVETLDNPYKDAGRRAGPSVAVFLAQKGVGLVVAGKFGERMIQAMKSQGIEYMEFLGNAESALEEVKKARK